MKTEKGLEAELLADSQTRAEHDPRADALAMARELVAARGRAGLTQGELARRMGTTQSAIARLESGKCIPSMRTLQRYATTVGARATVRLEAGSSQEGEDPTRYTVPSPIEGRPAEPGTPLGERWHQPWGIPTGLQPTETRFPRERRRPKGIIEKRLVDPYLLVTAEEDRLLALLCKQYGVRDRLSSSHRDLALAMARVHHREALKKGRPATWKPDPTLLLCWEVNELKRTCRSVVGACKSLAKDPLWHGFAQSVEGTYESDTAGTLKSRYYEGMRRKNIEKDLRLVRLLMLDFERLFPGGWPGLLDQVKRKLLPRHRKSRVNK